MAAAFMLAYLLAAGLVLLWGGRVPGAAWLALHLVLLGMVTNAIMIWNDQFTAALLHARPSGETAAVARLVVLNLAVVAVLAGVHSARPALTAAGALLLTAVVVAHALTCRHGCVGAWPPGSARWSGSTWRPVRRWGPGSGWGCC